MISDTDNNCLKLLCELQPASICFGIHLIKDLFYAFTIYFNYQLSLSGQFID